MITEQGLKEKVHQIAKEKGLPFNISWKQLLFERFLCRLSTSEVKEYFIFKGGLLLSFLMQIGRETADLDFLIEKIDVQKDKIENSFRKICSIDLQDGFSFSFKRMEVLAQPHMEYEGFRVSLR